MITYADMGKDDRAKEITKEVVKHAARLSRLSLGEADVVKFQGQLSRILDYIGQLNEVDVKEVPPTTHVIASLKNVFREIS